MPDDIPDLQDLFGDLSVILATVQARGWVVPNHLAHEGRDCWIIEAGSVGVHKGYVDSIGYWIVDGETYPSHPFAVLLKEEPEPYAKIYHPATDPT